MSCYPAYIEAPDGYTKPVEICTNQNLPKKIKGRTDGYRIEISKDLDDLYGLGISDPETYVLIHECFHIIHPKKNEYEIRILSDIEYEIQTGERVDTTCYFKHEGSSSYSNFLKEIKKSGRFD
ncbi:MAG: hypothetical protein V1818_04630 [Candidatus Aenigmatarchaeota archaeon]